jgi:hypothetical protein
MFFFQLTFDTFMVASYIGLHTELHKLEKLPG